MKQQGADKKQHALDSPLIEQNLEKHVAHCEVLLGAGKGHLGVINYLRKCRIEEERLDTLSRDIFERANQRLYRSQLPLRLIAGSLILIGILVPAAFYLTGDGIPVITIVPMFMGMVLRTKVLRPKALPSTLPQVQK